MKTFHFYNDQNDDICHYLSKVLTVNASSNTVCRLGTFQKKVGSSAKRVLQNIGKYNSKVQINTSLNNTSYVAYFLTIFAIWCHSSHGFFGLIFTKLHPLTAC